MVDTKKIVSTKKGLVSKGISEGMKNKFTIRERLITLNEYIKIERNNRYTAGNVKKKFTALAEKYAKEMMVLDAGLYDLEITWNVTSNREDPDNVYFAIKFILDGVVDAGRLPNDNRRYIRHISNKIFTCKEYSVEVVFVKV